MKKTIFASLLLACICSVAFAQQPKASIRLVRSATLLIDYGGQRILLDPMLGDKGSLGSISGKGVTPSVDLVMPIEDITKDLDFVLVTHAHLDHFDDKAFAVLDKSLKVYCQPEDRHIFLYRSFWDTDAVTDSVTHKGVTIIRTEAQHGTGRILKAMGESSGYVLKAEGMPVVYIIGDGVWTQGVYNNIEKYKPDYIVVNSGGAVDKNYKSTPIIMDEKQVMALVQESGKAKIIAVHMDAVDHCRTTRTVLRKEAKQNQVSTEKLIIPEDGEAIDLQ